MKKEAKILITDINADRNRIDALKSYQGLLAAGFNNYATIKLSMNLFTLYEMSEEIELDRREEIEGYIDTINSAIRSIYSKDLNGSEENRNDVVQENIKNVVSARDEITERMKVLTAYTDSLEIYEYILNRREPEIKGEIIDDIDTDSLAQNMYDFVFSENDKMLINTRIQDFIAQLPVRMAKNRFFDIVSNSLYIYKGGERKAVDDFADTIRDAAMINPPEKMQEYYPRLMEILGEFREADYKSIGNDEYEHLNEILAEATDIIQSSVTDYLMLTEIINDVLVVLYSDSISDSKYLSEEYDTSQRILKELIMADDIYEASERFDELFVSLEGAQEDAYENLAFVESYLEDLYATYYEMYDDKSIKSGFDSLMKADKLTSSSLFMDIDDRPLTIVNDEADEAYINELRGVLIDELTNSFSDKSKFEKRSIIAKVLSLMPVFFNTQQEIHDYFAYALSGCSDKSELTACKNIVEEMMI